MPDVRLVLTLDNGCTRGGIRFHDLALVPTDRRGHSWGTSAPTRCVTTGTPRAVSGLLAGPDRLRWSRALLDQPLMAGLGNLWANELAFLTGVSPWTPIGEVDVPRLVERAATAAAPLGRPSRAPTRSRPASVARAPTTG